MRSSDWSSYVCSSDLSTFRSDGRASHRRWPRCACSSVRKGRPSPPAKRSCATAANRIPFSERRRILSLSLCDDDASPRSEEHTSELQSLLRLSYAVFCLKKKNHSRSHPIRTSHTS